jgi:hypothetical protein
MIGVTRPFLSPLQLNIHIDTANTCKSPKDSYYLHVQKYKTDITSQNNGTITKNK